MAVCLFVCLFVKLEDAEIEPKNVALQLASHPLTQSLAKSHLELFYLLYSDLT
jgi:hypothetical protein